jgi:hypothetical protein
MEMLKSKPTGLQGPQAGSLEGVTITKRGAASPRGHLYTLTRGLASSSSLMTPHLVNTRTISASVASDGSPDTYTLLFFCSWNHLACRSEAGL